jgi:hypothetical protein
VTRKAAPKAREAVHHRAKPCEEVVDGKNFERFDGLAGMLLSLSPEDALNVRLAAQPRAVPKTPKQKRR